MPDKCQPPRTSASALFSGIPYRNADTVNVDGQVLRAQTLEWYLQNADPHDALYLQAEQWIQAQ